LGLEILRAWVLACAGGTPPLQPAGRRRYILVALLFSCLGSLR
jgi:hypothetical protein